MKNSVFKSNKKFFHVSLNFESSLLFKSLDWIYIQKTIDTLAKSTQIEVQSLVMMDTHLHMLISTFEQNENYFCENLQMKLSPKSPIENLSEPILNYSQYLNTYKYIYRNPVMAGLSLRAENYTYSSLYYLIGKAHLHCSVHDQLGLIQNPLHILKWLNQEMDYKISQLKLLRQSNSLLM